MRARKFLKRKTAKKFLSLSYRAAARYLDGKALEHAAFFDEAISYEEIKIEFIFFGRSLGEQRSSLILK